MFTDNLLNAYRRVGDPAGIEQNNYLSVRGQLTRQNKVVNLNNLLPKGVALSENNIYVPDMVVYNPYLDNATRFSRLPFKNEQIPPTYGAIYAQYEDQGDLLALGSILNRNFQSKKIVTIIKRNEELKEKITEKNMENLGIPQDEKPIENYEDMMS